MNQLTKKLNTKFNTNLTYNSRLYFKLGWFLNSNGEFFVKLKTDEIVSFQAGAMVGFFLREIFPLALMVPRTLSDKLVRLMNCLIKLPSNTFASLFSWFKPTPTLNLAAICEAIFKLFSQWCSSTKESFFSLWVT